MQIRSLGDQSRRPNSWNEIKLFRCAPAPVRVLSAVSACISVSRDARNRVSTVASWASL